MQEREMGILSGRGLSLVAVLGVAVVLSACSGDGFYEAVGLSKSSPDETKVSTTQPLALPPDYSLPPPQEPRQIAEPAPDPVPAAQVQTAAASQPTQITGGESGATEGTTQEPAISTVNPDGTPKTQRQIYDEALAKKKATRKAQNENYGTWRNILGAIWN